MSESQKWAVTFGSSRRKPVSLAGTSPSSSQVRPSCGSSSTDTPRRGSVWGPGTDQDKANPIPLTVAVFVGSPKWSHGGFRNASLDFLIIHGFGSVLAGPQVSDNLDCFKPWHEDTLVANQSASGLMLSTPR